MIKKNKIKEIVKIFIKIKNIERFLRKFHFKKLEDNNIKLYYKLNGNIYDFNKNLNINTHFRNSVLCWRIQGSRSTINHYVRVHDFINTNLLYYNFQLFYNFFIPKKNNIYR